MLYISERIANISELERQIQNAKLHFDILKEELKHTAPSATIDSALWFLGKSLELLSTADVAYFAEGWNEFRGCKIEHTCAVEYDINRIEE